MDGVTEGKCGGERDERYPNIGGHPTNTLLLDETLLLHASVRMLVYDAHNRLSPAKLVPCQGNARAISCWFQVVFTFSSQTLSNTVWAYATLGINDHLLMESMAQRALCADVVASFDAQEVIAGCHSDLNHESDSGGGGGTAEMAIERVKIFGGGGVGVRTQRPEAAREGKNG